MSRSLKKPPFVHYKLVIRVDNAKASESKAVIKTWSRASTITPDFVGLTFAVHNGNKFIPVFATENMVGHKLGEFSPTRNFRGHGGNKKDKKRQNLIANSMGARKRLRAENMKEARTTLAFAKLNDSPIAPRKMRLVADLVRGVEVNKALNILQHNSKNASVSLGKLLRSAIANWETKNEGKSIEEETLIVKSIEVGGGAMLKRIQPAPQGRAHRVRKRSNHVTITVDGAIKVA